MCAVFKFNFKGRKGSTIEKMKPVFGLKYYLKLVFHVLLPLWQAIIFK
jgi:hypothetical protein